jgi:hypothetical protein
MGNMRGGVQYEAEPKWRPSVPCHRAMLLALIHGSEKLNGSHKFTQLARLEFDFGHNNVIQR